MLVILVAVYKHSKCDVLLPLHVEQLEGMEPTRQLSHPIKSDYGHRKLENKTLSNTSYFTLMKNGKKN